MYVIQKNSKISLHIQLFEEIKKDIIENCKIGDKLPSIRKVTTLYNLSKNTVESTYSQLVVEGYIDSVPQSGYFVIHSNMNNFSSSQINKDKIEEKEQAYLYNFFPARLSKDSFPLKLWKRLFTKAINESLDFGAYTKNGQGELGLREQITHYLAQSRGVRCNVNQVVVCCGFADSMGLLAKILKNRFNIFATENPGYHIARKVFNEYNYKIEKIGIDNNGLLLEELEISKAKLVYITPSHQYPMGVVMPISNRQKLLQWAQDVDGLIIEDDYDSELSYENRPIPSLQGLDNKDRVVYLGTFSKSLSPAIRVSYMVLPNHLLPLYKNHFESEFQRVCLSVQKTLELFMKEGHWEKHLRKIRTLNKKKHNLMKNTLIQELGNSMRIETQGGGLSILINPIVAFDFEKLKYLAHEKKLKIYFAKRNCGGDWDAIRMGFGGFKEGEIKNAVEAFSKIWHQSIILKNNKDLN